MPTAVVPSKPVNQTITANQHRQGAANSTPSDRLIQLMRSVYQADHQVKLLHLHAEADTLLQQLQVTLKQRQN